VGTLGEVAAAWNGMQTGEIPAKPLVLVGPAWRATFDVFLAEMDGLVKPADSGLLTFCVDPAEAVIALRGPLG
jgi:predicted Rossmann-fold nucleotide-binding protein